MDAQTQTEKQSQTSRSASRAPRPFVCYAAILLSVYLGTWFSPTFKLAARMDVGLYGTNITFYRMLLTIAVLWTICLCKRALRKEVKEVLCSPHLWGMLCAMGLFRGLELLCWSYTLGSSTTFVLNILSNSSPIFVWIASYFLYGEKPSLRAAAGIGVCLAGLCAVGMSGTSTGATNGFGILAMMASALLHTAFLLVSRKMRVQNATIGATVLLTFVFTVSFVCTVPSCIVEHSPMGPFPPRAWMLLLAMAVGPTVLNQLIPVWALRHVSATNVSMLSLSGPLLTALTCAMVLGERPDVAVLVGGTVVLIGLGWYVYMDERDRRERAARRAPVAEHSQNEHSEQSK